MYAAVRLSSLWQALPPQQFAMDRGNLFQVFLDLVIILYPAADALDLGFCRQRRSRQGPSVAFPDPRSIRAFACPLNFTRTSGQSFNFCG
ncbi:MAG: hypothetical protein DMG57_09570 [Acidobacteria bacterium]|nr:MAG: hypothetical protein DMG57_09570 [Acidobacteriota bacterium]